MNFNILMSPLTPHPHSTLFPQSWCFKTSFHIHDLACSPKIRANKVDSHIKKEWNNTPKGVLIYKTPKTHPLLSSDYPFLTITSSNTPQCVDLSQNQKKTTHKLVWQKSVIYRCRYRYPSLFSLFIATRLTKCQVPPPQHVNRLNMMAEEYFISNLWEFYAGSLNDTDNYISCTIFLSNIEQR